MSSLGENIKKLGFGFMRLPRLENGAFDIEHSKKMVDLFLAAGCTYFDTAWAYTGSEDALRQALVERYPRDAYHLATKVSAWIKGVTKENVKSQFQISLDRTGAGFFDFYLLHNLGHNRTQLYEDYGLWDFAQEKKAQGLIKHLGFSFHSTAEELEEILTKHPEAEFVQLQINYADWENPTVQSKAIYEVARKHNKPIIVMEPVKGGLLSSPADSVAKIFRAAAPDMSLASWALRFAANLDGVMTVLSGMSNCEQVQDNLSFMKDFKKLTAEESATIEAARNELKKVPLIPCTSCNYCTKGCPKEVQIPETFAAMNSMSLYKDTAIARQRERALKGESPLQSALKCIQCGACEDACPQHITIRKFLADATKMLDTTITPA